MPDPEQIAAEMELIEAAMSGVEIVPCFVCTDGKVGLETFQATCPRCGGTQQTTANQLEEGPL